MQELFLTERRMLQGTGMKGRNLMPELSDALAWHSPVFRLLWPLRQLVVPVLLRLVALVQLVDEDADERSGCQRDQDNLLQKARFVRWVSTIEERPLKHASTLTAAI